LARSGLDAAPSLRAAVEAPAASEDQRRLHVLLLCVMSYRRAPKAERVGIRELRQNLSVYVKRVREEGRAYEVTERGEPVARLTPLEDRPASLIERMIAEGRITPPTRAWGAMPEPVRLPPGGPTLSQVLQQMRDEDPR
jgi:prevent-host-death family protein